MQYMAILCIDLHKRALQAPAGRCAAPFTREGGHDAVPALLALDLDAVLASNEMQAIGLLAGLHRAGVRVPDDIAVVGLNGTASARFTVPALTRSQPIIRQPKPALLSKEDPTDARTHLAST